MLSLRRSALRIITSSPSSFACKPRTITSLSSSTFTRTKPAQLSFYQRRWASDEAEAPISKLQPTPEEEVENAIKTEDAEDAAPVANATKSAAAALVSPQQDTAGRDQRTNSPKETVYVGNLFFDVTEEDLKREMSRFGAVRKCRLMRDSRGLSKGFAYVDFESTEAATAAMEALHQQLFEGRRMVVQYAAYTTSEMDSRRHQATRFNSEVRGPRNPPSKTLFIGNMSFEMTDRDLNKLFTGIRNVTDVRVAIDRRTGQPRGFAHADFTDIASAQEALKVLEEKETYGRKLRIDYSFGSSMAPRNQNPPPSRSGGAGSE